MRSQFWQHHKLDELTHAEWEALCDGCGLCCLIKLRDDDTDEIAYTSLACQLLDCNTGKCRDYPNRKQHVPDCVQLTANMLTNIDWLPKTCAYRCVHESRPLPMWHPLLTGKPNSVQQAGVSVAGRCLSEAQALDEEVEDYVVKWVKI